MLTTRATPAAVERLSATATSSVVYTDVNDVPKINLVAVVNCLSAKRIAPAVGESAPSSSPASRWEAPLKRPGQTFTVASLIVYQPHVICNAAFDLVLRKATDGGYGATLVGICPTNGSANLNFTIAAGDERHVDGYGDADR